MEYTAAHHAAATCIARHARGYSTRQRVVHAVRSAFEQAMKDVTGNDDVNISYKSHRHVCMPRFESRDDGDDNTTRREQLERELAWAEATLARRVAFLADQTRC
ncbi:hypothetical protein PPROV_000296700 [Pycnococcus provasolii]|uniref:Uncharacterized protein n=1 Tax=Pycnococcus provasolii TaxID=41880 RepID=A0A830HCJ9_9CHLO|nr:hypothetical protein PPROV_000296700 [Pycnococcus provasolii]